MAALLTGIGTGVAAAALASLLEMGVGGSGADLLHAAAQGSESLPLR